jgi:hypothetical protein
MTNMMQELFQKIGIGEFSDEEDSDDDFMGCQFPSIVSRKRKLTEIEDSEKLPQTSLHHLCSRRQLCQFN